MPTSTPLAHLGTGVVTAASLVCCSAAPGLADKPGLIPGTVDCTPFTAGNWVNPYPPNEVGHHYQVVVSGKGFTCKTADPYAKKFIKERLENTATLGVPSGVVSGGPKGFKCTSGIAKNGIAYQGGCIALHPTPSTSSFTWGPFNDS